MRYYFIYKTTHKNGKYYIGRHSTDNLDDGYIGSGKWPRSIKDKSTVSREILEFASDDNDLLLKESAYLQEHYGRPNCMNATSDPIGFDSGNNPMKKPEVAAKISGENHWFLKNPKRHREAFCGGNHWMMRKTEAKEQFLKNHPNKDGRNAKKAYANGTHVFLANNPSVWRSKEGIHHWQNGNSPNAGGKLNRQLIEEGRHNLIGPEHNRKMIAEGKNPWVGSDMNNKLLAEGRHPSQRKQVCDHCGKETSIGMYKRWHGDRCKQKA